MREKTHHCQLKQSFNWLRPATFVKERSPGMRPDYTSHTDNSIEMCNETPILSVSLHIFMLSRENLDDALRLLEEELRSNTDVRHDLVVCGGSALLALEFITRTTRDVDIIATLKNNRALVSPEPLPPLLMEAARNVGRLLDLPEDWLNTGPASQLKAGLPEGFAERLILIEIGPALRIHYAGRFDLIHLKFFAYCDQGPGKHLDDLLRLEPTAEEIEAAARWTLTQDAGEEFPKIVKNYLNQLGYEDLARRL